MTSFWCNYDKMTSFWRKRLFYVMWVIRTMRLRKWNLATFWLFVGKYHSQCTPDMCRQLAREGCDIYGIGCEFIWPMWYLSNDMLCCLFFFNSVTVRLYIISRYIWPWCINFFPVGACGGHSTDVYKTSFVTWPCCASSSCSSTGTSPSPCLWTYRHWADSSVATSTMSPPVRLRKV